MPTYRTFAYAYRGPLPEGFTNEVRTPDALVEHFLAEYTDPGDRVLDVFAGFGTTLAVAEDLGRVPVGIEYEPERVACIEDRLETTEHVRQGSVLDLKPSQVATCECCFTSPPFTVESMETNPFENYDGESSDDGYLEDLETAFGRVAAVLAPGGHAIVDVPNVKYDGSVTTLAWDAADRISEVLEFDGEVVIGWEGEGPEDREGNFGYGYDHSYCLVFSKDR